MTLEVIIMSLRKRMRWIWIKWLHGHCRHICRLCRYRDECLLDIMVEIDRR